MKYTNEMNEVETIENLISEHVRSMNYELRNNDNNAFERFYTETIGMLICLNSISKTSDKFYNIYIAGEVVFGYYDGNLKWNVINGD